MSYVMLLPFMIPVAIILLLISTLNKEKEKNITPAENSGKINAVGERCYQKAELSTKRNLNDYVDLSGGSMGI